MSIFILIHGSWHNAWNWHRVIPVLQNMVHTAIAIDLPGMGRDRTPIEDVTLDGSAQKITDLIDSLDEKVILVGHSKNGIVISAAAEKRPDKIEKNIYLAAYLVPNGKSQSDYSSQDIHGVLKPYVTRYSDTRSHTLQPAIYRAGLYHDCDEDIIQLANCLLSHESAVTGITPLNLTEENYGRVNRYYIECTEDRAVTPYIQQKMYSESPCKKVYKMATSHSPFFSKPLELCEILNEIASDDI